MKEKGESTKADTATQADGSGRPGLLARLIQKGMRWYDYLVDGVWNETRKSAKVDFVKTVSLSVRSFLNSDLQMRAGYLTYQTILAIVPVLALLFAIGRGFGFQNLLETQLFESFPGQHEALEKAFSFVDSYLAQSSEGVFVGVGLLFLFPVVDPYLADKQRGNEFQQHLGCKAGEELVAKTHRLHRHLAGAPCADDLQQRHHGVYEHHA